MDQTGWRNVASTLSAHSTRHASTSWAGDKGISFCITGNADGQLAPPMIFYAYERIPGPIAAAAPAGWSLGHSKSGWMTQESLYEYVTSVFYKWCLDNHLKFPIILFIDGHRSYLTLALSDFCVQHELKLNWNKIVATWRMEHGRSVSGQREFCSSSQ
ncbi:hypothetical protein ALC60_09372 [Trachymyrmex zeteki]|uniref:DDE-1 domain-containing protein n=1 Tax=Mycetomoellerius zeteki TaxID=64791 RepID=A0A151WUA3_9HYME|nr:hypothetical protein ALC60_09372 [Trachymyrmex zeteki]